MFEINLENGRTSIPSVAKIQTNGDNPLVGNAAIRAQFPWTKMTLFDSKRMIGMKVIIESTERVMEALGHSSEIVLEEARDMLHEWSTSVITLCRTHTMLR